MSKKTKDEAELELMKKLQEFVAFTMELGDCAKSFMLEHDLDEGEEKLILQILGAVNQLKIDTKE